MSARVTMKDIAAELGVSINTVHKALTGKAGVSESVRAKVNAKACLLYTSPSPRDRQKSRMPSSA